LAKVLGKVRQEHLDKLSEKGGQQLLEEPIVIDHGHSFAPAPASGNKNSNSHFDLGHPGS
jgi:hypothetical protein